MKMKLKQLNKKQVVRAMVWLAVTGLVGCGGGEQVKKFQPSNMVSFGDESSAFTQETVDSATIGGLKYSVNALAIGINLKEDLITYAQPVVNPANPNVSGLKPLEEQVVWLQTSFLDSGTYSVDNNYPQQVTRVLNLDTYYDLPDPEVPVKADVTYQYFYSCSDNRLWIQILANSYGLGYNQACPLDSRGNAVSYAAPGAKVSDVVAQINAHLGAVTSNTLVTVLAGQNDILEQFDLLYPDLTSANTPTQEAINGAISVLESRGMQLGQAVNTLAFVGARTLVITVPDISYSPRFYPSGVVDTAKQSVMRSLIVAFNTAIFDRGGARSDGHLIGLVNGFDLISRMAKSPIPEGSANAYGLINVTSSACADNGRSIDTRSSVAIDTSANLKYCNNATLVAGATPYNYLWAFDTWLTPRGHSTLAESAFLRADNDTF